MAAPTVTTKIVNYAADGTRSDLSPSDVSGVLTSEVDYGTNLVRQLNVKVGSGTAYMYLSEDAGTLPIATLGTTAVDTAQYFNLENETTFYVIASGDTDIDATTHAIKDTAAFANTAEVSVIMVADLNKIVVKNSFTVGLGNTAVLSMSKVSYATGGINIKAALGKVNLPDFYCMIRADVWDGTPKTYPACYNAETGKLVVFQGFNAAELAANTVVYGTAVMIKA